jgi:EmrB/QacA subfamily drug resistance transporter
MNSSSNPGEHDLSKQASADSYPLKWWVLVAIGISTFMSALDGSVVNTVLPVINRSFGSSIAAIEWVVTIYLLVLSGLLLSFGRLGDLRGHKSVYMLGFAVFLIGSGFCGFSRSALNLVFFRAIQALGAAMIQANSPAIITKGFPGAQRGQALGMVATMTYLGLTVGPSFGGWLAEMVSWRVVFYINIPVGLLAFWLSLRFIPNDRPTLSKEQFDLLGAITFTSGLVLLLFALNQGHALGWFSPIILGLIISAVFTLVLFIRTELRSPAPMLDLRLFRNRIFSASVSSAIFNYICLYSIVFLLPFYLIQGRGFTPSQTGLLLTAQPIIMAIVAPISGSFSDRIGTRLPVVAGMLTLAFGLILLSRLDGQSSHDQIALALGVAGLGTGTFISPNNSALMGAAPRNRQGIAAGILATARNLGMVLGVGLAGAIFTTILGNLGTKNSPAVFAAIHITFLVTAVFALMGAVIAATRNR